ncbi:MAG TPA: TadE/TadG family type IV pilus assembly protein, partial [Candidatus Sulfotelmatobacter sp.]|nr:TadE/TadG family type IV pilus assembly protein [Candidatus Sulfotelmatobacter sp.]
MDVRPRQRGQSLVEFAISSIVLLLLAMGLLDLSRAFYYAVNLQGAAREGARHGAWFNTSARANNFLDNGDIMFAVNQSLQGAGLNGTQVITGRCLVPTDGNTAGNKPYPQSAYPAGPNAVNVYICYTFPG